MLRCSDSSYSPHTSSSSRLASRPFARPRCDDVNSVAGPSLPRGPSVESRRAHSMTGAGVPPDHRSPGPSGRAAPHEPAAVSCRLRRRDRVPSDHGAWRATGASAHVPGRARVLVRSGVSWFHLAVLAAGLATSAALQADCDGDGTPDDEEVAAGAPDCNENGIPDACDLVGTPFGAADAARIPFGSLVFGLEAADLDGDGAGDVAACTTEGVSVFFQRSAGEFELR